MTLSHPIVPDKFWEVFPPPALAISAFGLLCVALPMQLNFPPVLARWLTAIGTVVLLLTFSGVAIYHVLPRRMHLWIAEGFAPGWFAACLSFLLTGWLYWLVNIYSDLPGVSPMEKCVRLLIVTLPAGAAVGPVLCCCLGWLEDFFFETPQTLVRQQVVKAGTRSSALTLGSILLLLFLFAFLGLAVYAADNIQESIALLIGVKRGFTGPVPDQGDIQFWQVWCMLMSYVAWFAAILTWRSGGERRQAVYTYLASRCAGVATGILLLPFLARCHFGSPEKYTPELTPAPKVPSGLLLVALLFCALVSFFSGMWGTRRLMREIEPLDSAGRRGRELGRVDSPPEGRASDESGPDHPMGDAESGE